MTKSIGAVVLLCLLVVAGCATLASGTSQMLTVSSNVDGAAVYLDGEQVGTTPFTSTVPKGKRMLRVEAPGYRSETLSLSRSLDPVFWGNIILGGTLGSITDFATGAAYQYAPAAYQVELRRGDQAEAEFHRQVSVRKFALLYVDPITRDIAGGGGDYLDALLHLINDGATEAVTADAIHRALEASRGDRVAFGSAVIGLL